MTVSTELHQMFNQHFQITVTDDELTSVLSRNFVFLSQHIHKYTHTHMALMVRKMAASSVDGWIGK
jgi:hypothetical protein